MRQQIPPSLYAVLSSEELERVDRAHAACETGVLVGALVALTSIPVAVALGAVSLCIPVVVAGVAFAGASYAGVRAVLRDMVRTLRGRTGYTSRSAAKWWRARFLETSK